MTPDDTKLPIEPNTTEEATPEPLPLAYVVYAIVLVSSGVAVSPNAVVPAIIILFCWACVFYSQSRPSALLIVWCLLFIVCCVPMLLPSLETPWPAIQQRHCRANLWQIGLALHNYHDVYDSFPPAITRASDGTPLHSWRALILPYLDVDQQLYDYRIDEPWNGPHNSKLLEQMPSVYSCLTPERSDAEAHITRYVAVIGENTFWPGDGARSIFDADDGITNTILVVECDAANTPWLKPEDLEMDQAIEWLTILDPHNANGHQDEDYLYVYNRGRPLLLGDGAVRFMPARTPSSRWQAGLLLNDGESIDGDDPWTTRFEEPVRVRKLGNWMRLGWFVLVSLFPLPWVWWNPTSSRQTMT